MTRGPDDWRWDKRHAGGVFVRGDGEESMLPAQAAVALNALADRLEEIADIVHGSTAKPMKPVDRLAAVCHLTAPYWREHASTNDEEDDAMVSIPSIEPVPSTEKLTHYEAERQVAAILRRLEHDQGTRVEKLELVRLESTNSGDEIQTINCAVSIELHQLPAHIWGQIPGQVK